MGDKVGLGLDKGVDEVVTEVGELERVKVRE